MKMKVLDKDEGADDADEEDGDGGRGLMYY